MLGCCCVDLGKFVLRWGRHGGDGGSGRASEGDGGKVFEVLF